MNATINLDYVNARRLLLPALDKVSLVLVGCGGTGSWLAPSVVRVARLLMEKFGKTVGVYFVDPDVVEQKNCYRQNFCEAEIGRNKAESMAFRYGLAWGIEISANAMPIERFHRMGDHNELVIYIGCVDNAAARREIGRRTKDGARNWWLDCGNERSCGQVLLGGGGNKNKNPFELAGFCTWLPMPSEQHADLFENAMDSAPNEAGMSCAELVMQDSQGLAINQRIAAEATDYLVRMLLTRDLLKMATYIDLASGATRSKYINPDVVSTVSVETVEAA